VYRRNLADTISFNLLQQQVYHDNGPSTMFESASNIGNNGYWEPMLEYYDIYNLMNVSAFSVCFPGSGAITSISYCDDEYHY
jgi:hypothetical protein